MINHGNNYRIFDEDCLLLMGKTISQQILSLISSGCLICSQPFSEQNKSIDMPCGCNICLRCADDKAKASTGGKFILNNFEKSKKN